MNNTNVKHQVKTQKRCETVLVLHLGLCKADHQYKLTVHTYTGANVHACYPGE